MAGCLSRIFRQRTSEQFRPSSGIQPDDPLAYQLVAQPVDDIPVGVERGGQPTRAALERRIEQLEAEVAQLKDSARS